MKKCVFLLVMSLFVFVPTWSQDSGDSEWAGTPDEPQGSEIDGLVYFFSSEYGAAYLRRDNIWEGELVIPAEVEHKLQLCTYWLRYNCNCSVDDQVVVSSEWKQAKLLWMVKPYSESHNLS